MDLANLSSNWKKLQAQIATKTSPQSATSGLKRKRVQPISNSHTAARQPGRKRHKSGTMETNIEKKLSVSSAINAGRSQDVEIGKYIALDCEMVGVGSNGAESALARVSIVNYNGEQVYDSYVLPKEEVIDWRTEVSGIKPGHMKEARTLEEVQQSVSEILTDRIVIGHALRHDFRALLLDHPIRDVRDTSKLASYRRLAGGTPKLSLLASELLGLEIQGGEHSSLEDARACMLLFRRDKDAFEGRKGKGRPRGKKK